MAIARRYLERAVLAVYGLLPPAWSRGRRMFVTGLTTGTAISIPAMVIRILLGA